MSDEHEPPYRIKFIVGLLVMIVWLALTWSGKTPVEGFVDMLKQIMTGVVIYHTTLARPK